MKISPINLNNFKIQNFNVNKETKQSDLIYKRDLLMPTTSQYLAFMGGYTVNLAETFQQLDDKQYPVDIQEMVLKEIENRNPENKTLYDVHFEKYKGVLDCYSLDELKEKYPEFIGVKSAFEVQAKNDSFIGKFQLGENEIFANNEDLTLQLIKLYWGQGFSLNGLSDYIEDLSQNKKGIQLRYTLEKLNIPMMDRRYASVLKLSNKEYNDRFTQEMSNRLREAKEARRQQQEGEPVYIPRGPLSESHKKHISEGLKKYYQEHPESLFQLSDRQIKYYQEHPERAEEMREVMLYAWNETDEGKSVLKGIKRAMRKNNIDISPEELANLPEINNKKQEVLKEFWKRNEWAKEKFSIAVKKGYAYLEEIKLKPQQKELSVRERLGFENIPGRKYVFSNLPTQVRGKLNDWTKKQGLDPDNYTFSEGILYLTNTEKVDSALITEVEKKSAKLMDDFFALQPDLENLIADTYMLAIVDIMETLKNQKLHSRLPESLKNKPEIINTIYACAQEEMKDRPLYVNTGNCTIYAQGIETSYLNKIYHTLLYCAVVLGCADCIDYFQKIVDEKFEKRAKEIGFILN